MRCDGERATPELAGSNMANDQMRSILAARSRPSHASPPRTKKDAHDPEKLALDLIRGWSPVFGQDHAATEKGSGAPIGAPSIGRAS